MKCDVTLNMSAQHFQTCLVVAVLILEVHERPSLHVVKQTRNEYELGDSWIKSL